MNKFIKIPLVLALVTFFTSGLLMFSEYSTRDKIAEQKKLKLLKSLKQLIPDNLHDNDLIEDSQTINEPLRLGHRKPQTLYIGKLNGKETVMAIPVSSHKGYSGDIDLIVGVKKNGEITHVNILEQHETPGLGDLIEANKSDWIEQFPNNSLNKTEEKNWQVKRDGGSFDQITGATITPRAVVTAIKKALLYHEDISKNTENKTTLENNSETPK